MPSIPSETALPTAVLGTGRRAGAARMLRSLSSKSGAGDAAAEMWTAPGDAALPLCASVSLFRLVLSDHFCNANEQKDV